MKDDYPKVKDLDEFEYSMKSSPHVVIWGADTSCSTILYIFDKVFVDNAKKIL